MRPCSFTIKFCQTGTHGENIMTAVEKTKSSCKTSSLNWRRVIPGRWSKAWLTISAGR